MRVATRPRRRGIRPGVLRSSARARRRSSSARCGSASATTGCAAFLHPLHDAPRRRSAAWASTRRRPPSSTASYTVDRCTSRTSRAAGSPIGARPAHARCSTAASSSPRATSRSPFRRTLTFYLGPAARSCSARACSSPTSASSSASSTAQQDVRRDAAFSLFYMGINLGAFLGPIITGYLVQDERFRARLAGWGMDPNSAWHWGFGAAGVGMTLGLIQYVLGWRAPRHGGPDAADREFARGSSRGPSGRPRSDIGDRRGACSSLLRRRDCHRHDRRHERSRDDGVHDPAARRDDRDLRLALRGTAMDARRAQAPVS